MGYVDFSPVSFYRAMNDTPFSKEMEGIALGECEYKCMPNASDSDRNIVHSCFTKKKLRHT